jgi:hypothetical protein
VAHRLALRVENAGLQHDLDAGFHSGAFIQFTSLGPVWARPLVLGLTPRRFATSV